MRRALAIALAVYACGCEGSPGGADPQHNLDELNRYRTQAGVAPLTLDGRLSAFALDASRALESTRVPHGYYEAASSDGSAYSRGFCQSGAEIQAPGWRVQPTVDATVEEILRTMMAEGPGGGHHDAIVDSRFTRVGIGILVENGGVWLTNDFSEPCLTR